MAVLNPSTPATNTDWTGASRGTIPDTAFAGLFKDLGQTAGQGLKAFDFGVQKNIEKDVYKSYDEVNDEFGIPAAVNTSENAMGSKGPGVPPQDLSDSLGHLGLMQRAFNSGSLKSYHYWGRLENEVKSLRQKYPGYRDIIDQTVSNITGATPANALRSSLLSDMEQNANSEGDLTKKQYAWALENQDKVSPASAGRYFQGDMSFEEFRAEAQKQKFKESQNASVRNDLLLNDSLGKNTADGAIKQGTKEMDDIQQQIWQDTSSALGKNWAELKDKISKMSANGLDANETKELQGYAAQLQQSFETAISDTWSRPNDELSGSSLNTLLKGDFAGRDAFIKEARQQFNQIVTSTLSGDWGVFKLNQAMVDAQKNTDTFGILSRSDTLRKAQVINSIGGQELFGFLVNKRSDILSSTADAISDMTLTDMLGSTPDEQKAMSDYVKNIQETVPTEEQSAVTRSVIDDATTVITRPDAPDQLKKKAAQTLFSPENNDFFKYFNPGSKNENWIRLFGELASPNVTQSIIKMNDPEVFNNYKKWVYDKWPALFGSYAQDLNTAFDQTHGGVSFSYNPEANEFFPVIDRSKLDAASGGDPLFGQELIDVSQQRLTGINGYIKTLGPILDTDKQNKEQTVKQLMDSIGVKGVIYPSSGVPNNREKDNSLDSGKADTTPNTDLAFLDMIGKAEGAGYDTFSGGSNQDLTNKTVAEVRALQSRWTDIPGAASSAAGKPQIISETMDWLVTNGFLSDTEKFDKEAQDRAAIALLNRRGYGQYRSGRLGKDQFLDNLSQEWASIPNSSGVTSYADGVNRVTDGGRAIAALIKGK